MLGRFFPAFQAGKDGLPCITKRERRWPGVSVGGEAPHQNWARRHDNEAVESIGFIRVHRAVSSVLPFLISSWTAGYHGAT